MGLPLEFYDENIPCLAACPVHTNAGMYVAAIADGDLILRAVEQIEHEIASRKAGHHHGEAA